MANSSELASIKNKTTVVRKSERELVITRTFDATPQAVYAAWTVPEVFRQWWPPKSFGMSIVSCAMDVRVEGKYRLAFAHSSSETPMEFFGTYKEVTPNARLSWTNEESNQGALTTVTFEESAGKTYLTFHETYPSKQALDASIEGMEGGMPEQFAQLDELLSRGVT